VKEIPSAPSPGCLFACGRELAVRPVFRSRARGHSAATDCAPQPASLDTSACRDLLCARFLTSHRSAGV